MQNRVVNPLKRATDAIDDNADNGGDDDDVDNNGDMIGLELTGSEANEALDRMYADQRKNRCGRVATEKRFRKVRAQMGIVVTRDEGHKRGVNVCDGADIGDDWHDDGEHDGASQHDAGICDGERLDEGACEAWMDTEFPLPDDDNNDNDEQRRQTKRVEYDPLNDPDFNQAVQGLREDGALSKISNVALAVWIKRTHVARSSAWKTRRV